MIVEARFRSSYQNENEIQRETFLPNNFIQSRTSKKGMRDHFYDMVSRGLQLEAKMLFRTQ